MSENSNSIRQPNGTRRSQLRRRLPLLLVWFALAVLTIGVLGVLGGLYGYQTGLAEAESAAEARASQALVEQYTLGMADLEAGRYDLARQRFEFVLERDPQFPGAADSLVEAMRVLYATATPTPIPPTVTPTPTEDLRPIQEMLQDAQDAYRSEDWDATINILTRLREQDPEYEVVVVDSLIYRSLRNRGLVKIRDQGSLEGGIYDLSLAERFAPLDKDADAYRTLARLYVTGSGFWEVYPQQAAYYFGQVAAAAPYLSDSSGWTAFERYFRSVIQYAEQFGRDGDWCSAQEQFEAALRIRNDLDIQAKATEAALLCSPPTDTPVPVTDTPTPTFTWTPTGTVVILPTQTWTPSPTGGVTQATPTPTSTQPQAGATATVTLTPPGQTATATPSPTSTNTQPPPAVTPTNTLAPPSATPMPTQTEQVPTVAVTPQPPAEASATLPPP